MQRNTGWEPYSSTKLDAKNGHLCSLPTQFFDDCKSRVHQKNVCPPVTTDISLNTVDICRFAIVQHGHVGPLHGHIHEVRCLINDDKIGQRRIGKHPRQDWTVDQSSVTIPPSWPQQDRYTRFSDEHKKWLISYGQSILQCLLQCRSISRA